MINNSNAQKVLLMRRACVLATMRLEAGQGRFFVPRLFAERFEGKKLGSCSTIMRLIKTLIRDGQITLASVNGISRPLMLPMACHPQRLHQPESAMMRAEDVHIWWNMDHGRVTDVLVIDRHTVIPGYQCSDGACWVGWMDHPGFGPEEVFGKLVRLGFKNASYVEQAIRQFARVDQCQWARNMLQPEEEETN